MQSISVLKQVVYIVTTGLWRDKTKVKFVSLIKLQAMKTHRGSEASLHAFLTSALEELVSSAPGRWKLGGPQKKSFAPASKSRPFGL
jgi:hypothetical protein